MKITIIGAGGVGGYFGVRWVQAGHDVRFLARGAHLDAMRSRGLSIESPNGDALVRVNASADPDGLEPADLVVVATKTWQLPSVLGAVEAAAGPGTVVLGLQNGVEAADVLATAVGADRVLAGTCRIFSYLAEPGLIRHVGIDPTITFGEVDGGVSERARALEEGLRGAPGVRVDASADIQADLWRKFLFFAPTSGLGSATRAPAGVLRTVPEVRALLEAGVREVRDVAVAGGVLLDEDAVAKALAFIDRLPPEARSSMQRDFEAGRRSELEAICGAVVRLGLRFGVATPVHGFLYATLLPQELAARGE